MKLYRVAGPDGRPVWAERRDDRLVAADISSRMQRLAAATSREIEAGTDLGAVDETALLAPSRPTKVVCVGRNYRAHAEELDNPIPDEPLIFLKPPSTVVGPEAAIEVPPQSNEVHHEAEMAVVIGRRASGIAPEEADDHVAGYTCGNDVTARDIQRSEGQFTRAKGFDTFCPIGPALRTADSFEPADHTLTGRVDDETRQSSPLDDFIFSVPAVLAFITDVMTLQPGDVVMTGTPAGVGPIEVGQRVHIEIDGVGTLSNPVVERVAAHRLEEFPPRG